MTADPAEYSRSPLASALAATLRPLLLVEVSHGGALARGLRDPLDAPARLLAASSGRQTLALEVTGVAPLFGLRIKNWYQVPKRGFAGARLE